MKLLLLALSGYIVGITGVHASPVHESRGVFPSFSSVFSGRHTLSTSENLLKDVSNLYSDLEALVNDHQQRLVSTMSPPTQNSFPRERRDVSPSVLGIENPSALLALNILGPLHPEDIYDPTFTTTKFNWETLQPAQVDLTNVEYDKTAFRDFDYFVKRLATVFENAYYALNRNYKDDFRAADAEAVNDIVDQSFQLVERAYKLYLFFFEYKQLPLLVPMSIGFRPIQSLSLFLLKLNQYSPTQLEQLAQKEYQRFGQGFLLPKFGLLLPMPVTSVTQPSDDSDSTSITRFIPQPPADNSTTSLLIEAENQV